VVKCNNRSNRIFNRNLRFRKIRDLIPLRQKTHNLGLEPLAPYLDPELEAILSKDEDKKVVSDIIGFIKHKKNVDKHTVAKTLGLDILWVNVFLKILWKKRYIKRTKRKSDGEWLFSLR